MPAAADFVSMPAAVAALLTEVTIRPSTPGQQVHRAPYSGRTLVIDHDTGRWTGSALFGEARTDAEVQAVEGFFAGLRGQAGWTRLPIHRPQTIYGSTTLSSTTPGSVVVASASALSGTGGSLRRGCYIVIGGRLHIVTGYAAAQAANTLSIWPSSVAPAGADVLPATEVQAGNTPEIGGFRATADWYGPWQFSWEERL